MVFFGFGQPQKPVIQAEQELTDDFAKSLELAVASNQEAAEELGFVHIVESNTLVVPLRQGGPLFFVDTIVDSIVLGITTLGFLFNTVVGLFMPDANALRQLIDSFTLFFGVLKTILGSNERFWEILKNKRSFGNFLIVAKIVESRADGRRERVAVDPHLPVPVLQAFFQDSHHYMKYATAAYGPIQVAANVIGSVTPFLGLEGEEVSEQKQASERARKNIAKYLEIPVEDLLYCSAPGGKSDLINHLVAVNRDRKEVVLAIRGTYSVAGINTDLDAKGVDFHGGKAHGGFAERANQLLKHEPTIAAIERGLRLGLVDHNDEGGDSPSPYKLKLIGHSLGAGIACLVNIAIQKDPKLIKAPYSSLNCYGYACPPTFTFTKKKTPIANGVQCAIEDEDEAALYANCYCYIHQQDTVPFLSLHAGQRLFETLARVDEFTRNMNLFEFWWTVLGHREAPLVLRDIVKRASYDLEPQDGTGTERLKIPASRILWMRRLPNRKDYDYDFCSRTDLAKLSVNLDFPELITDHFPPEYDRAIRSISENYL